MTITTRGISILGRLLVSQIQKIPQIRSYKRWVSPTLKELQRRKQKLPEQKPNPRSSFLEWNYEAEIFAFAKRLNEDFNKDLLKQALTHKSYVFKQEQSNPDLPELVDNSKMISDGNELLKNYIQKKYEKYPDIIVNAIENYLMNEGKLSYIGRHIGLTDIILTEEYPIETATLSNTLKGLIAALEQSSGLHKTQKFIDDFILTQINDLDVLDIWEPKEPFKYFTEVMKDLNVEPRLCNQSAVNTILANNQVGLYSQDKKLLGIGWGESIDIAKDTAALDAIRKMYHL